MLIEKQRQGAVKHAEFLIANGPRHIGYALGGGDSWLGESMTGMEKRFAAGEMWTPDCSRTVNWITRWSGWKAFGRFGFLASSGEMWEALPRFGDVKQCGLGSLVVYGEHGSAHVAMVIAGAGTGNPTLFSHGSAFSANRVSYLAETEYHARLGQPHMFLAVGGLG